MVEVRLHGDLAKSFGRVWHLDIATPREAAAAIEANRPGFKKMVMDLADKGMVFRVRSRTHDYDETDIDTRLGSVRRIDIIPIVRGASAGVRFVIGAVLVVLSYIPGPWSPYLMQAGIALMLGSVVEWLTPKPKKEEVTKSLDSWTLSGPTNTADQGQPVPIIYGEVLTGSYPVSAGLIAAQVTPSGSLDSDVTFGGDLNPGGHIGVVQSTTVVLQVTALAFNLSDPLTYAWSYSGFVGASAVRMSDSSKATVRVEVDFPSSSFSVPGDQVVLSGQLSVSVTGKLPSTDQTATINRSTDVSASVLFVYVETSTGA